MTSEPVRLPDPASVEAVLAGLAPETADVELAPALSQAFPGFSFTAITIDDPYWRDARTVLSPDGTRLGDHRAWITRELAAIGGDLTAFWTRHRSGEFQFAEWRGTSAFAHAATGPGTADFVQIALGRETEFLAGPIVDPNYRPSSVDDLLEPSWVFRDSAAAMPRLAGPVYRLRGRAGGGVVHLKSFLGRCTRIERARREARRPELEQRIIREVGPEAPATSPSSTPTPPGFFDSIPREVRFFADWERSSAAAERIFVHWAFEISDYEHRGQRELGFIPRPLRFPSQRLLADDPPSLHRLMERIEAIDGEMDLPFAWFFLMTHGYWVDPDVGHAIAAGLRQQRVRLPDRDAKVLLDWADTPYLF